MVERAKRLVLLLAVVCLHAGDAAAASPQPAEPGWSEVHVPGGTAALARALDLNPAPDRARFLPELVRRLYGAPDGRVPEADARAARLRLYFSGGGGTGGTNSGSADAILLPLPPRVWARVLRKTIPEDRLFAAIVTNRRAALVAYGLAALDEDTLRQLAASPALVSRLVERHAGLVAAFGRSLRLRDGHVEVPGGGEARALWETLVGQPVTAPDRFLDALFSRSEGRLAYFYDALAQLDPPRQHFALGLWLPASTRAARFAALYAVFDSSYRIEWHPADRPFVRAAVDAAWLLQEIRVDASGRPTGPAWRSLWDRSLGPVEVLGDSSAELARLDEAEVVDAARLLEILNRPIRWERATSLATFTFAQRVFANVAPADAPAVLMALRASQRFPVLVASLERLGARTPSLYAAAGQRAAQLSALNPVLAPVALREFQAALTLIVHVRLAHVVGQATGEALVRTLLDVPIVGGRYDGGIARWLRETFLPTAAPQALADGQTAEDAVLAALAGVGTTAESVRAREVTWEGHTYRADVVTAELDRLRRIRERQGGASLDAALDLSELAARVAAAEPSPAAAAELASALHAFRERLHPIGAHGLPQFAGWPNTMDAIDTMLEALGRLATADPDRIAAAAALVAAGDALVGDVLASIAYALALGEPDDRTIVGINVSRRHDFGFALPEAGRGVPAWRLADANVGPGQPWHATGSLLALDVALSSFSLRWMVFDSDLHAPVLNGNDRRTFAESVALMNAFDLTDRDREAIARAVRAGRARVAAAGADAEALRALAIEAGLDPWRRQELPWIARREPDRIPATFSLGELWRLGGTSDAAAFDAWGMSAMPVNGCLCLRFPSGPDWSSWTGRAELGLLASRAVDLKLRVIELMADLQLPASLTRGVLAIATEAFVDQVEPSDPDDWRSVMKAAAGLTREQVEDYTAGLAANGPLVGDSGERAGGGRP